MRRFYGVIIVHHGERRESRAYSQSQRESKPHAYRRRTKQRTGNFRHTEAHGMADLRAQLRWSPGGGLFHDAGDCLTLSERIV